MLVEYTVVVVVDSTAEDVPQNFNCTLLFSRQGVFGDQVATNVVTFTQTFLNATLRTIRDHISSEVHRIVDVSTEVDALRTRWTHFAAVRQVRSIDHHVGGLCFREHFHTTDDFNRIARVRTHDHFVQPGAVFGTCHDLWFESW
ncbi:hypothetical protein D3C86_1580230 [compost metagenome]